MPQDREMEYLCELLAAADRIEMASVCKYATKRLHGIQPPLSPLKRILLCQEYSLPPYVWLYPAVVELLERAEPLNLDEAEQVGFELFQKIAMMRETLAPSRDEHGALPLTRAQFIQYVSCNLEGHPGRPSVVPLPAHRWITE